MNKMLYLLGLAGLCMLFIGCGGKTPKFMYQKNEDLKKEIQSLPISNYPDVKYAVLSDIHVYDKSLGVQGKAFQSYLDNDRKMLVESEEILSSAIDQIKTKDISFVIISGDLTKDGEITSHKIVAKYLQKLKDSKIQVFVVPGNHDLNNTHAVSFHGEKTTRVASANREDFLSIYHSFGYDTAIAKDPNSLSYIIEPIQGLWIFALDSNMYRENTMKKDPIVNGKFYDETLEWLEQQLIEANKKGKSIIAFFHHGILEHYENNEKFYPEYLVKHYKTIGEMLAFYNVRLVHTGHFHANDISFKRFRHNKFLYDVETGSLVSAPSPYRLISLENNTADIKTLYITSIPTHKDFTNFSKEYTKSGLEVLSKNIMESYWVSKKDQDYIAPFISKAFLAHFYGDEVDIPMNEKLPDSKKLGLFGKIVLHLKKDLILSIWKDLPPKDNNIVLDLQKGL